MRGRERREVVLKKRWSARDVAVTGVMIAALEAVKHALAFLPNVELVTLLVILYALYFKNRVLPVVAAFILLEGLWYGFGLWWVMYAYIWPLLALLARLFRKQESRWFWSVFSGAFGLAFGALYSLPYFFLGGPRTAFAWWVAGIPYDIIHCVSNFILCLVLFVPLRACMRRAAHWD